MKKKKSFRFAAFVLVLSIFSGVSAIASGIFLKSYNNSLIVQKQDMERKINDLQKKNESCKEDLMVLEGNDRISKAAGKGMTYQPERVTVIQNQKAGTK